MPGGCTSKDQTLCPAIQTDIQDGSPSLIKGWTNWLPVPPGLFGALCQESGTCYLGGSGLSAENLAMLVGRTWIPPEAHTASGLDHAPPPPFATEKINRGEEGSGYLEDQFPLEGTPRVQILILTSHTQLSHSTRIQVTVGDLLTSMQHLKKSKAGRHTRISARQLGMNTKQYRFNGATHHCHLLRNMFYFPLVGFEGNLMYHLGKYFIFQGTTAIGRSRPRRRLEDRSKH